MFLCTWTHGRRLLRFWQACLARGGEVNTTATACRLHGRYLSCVSLSNVPFHGGLLTFKEFFILQKPSLQYLKPLFCHGPIIREEWWVLSPVKRHLIMTLIKFHRSFYDCKDFLVFHWHAHVRVTCQASMAQKFQLAAWENLQQQEQQQILLKIGK